jgi:hypothetical protein
LARARNPYNGTGIVRGENILIPDLL